MICTKFTFCLVQLRAQKIVRNGDYQIDVVPRFITRLCGNCLPLPPSPPPCVRSVRRNCSAGLTLQEMLDKRGCLGR